MSFPRYPAYKPTGVEWLGEVPEHWAVVPLKSIASVINGYPFESKLFDPTDGFPLVRIRDLNQSAPDTYYNAEFVQSAAIDNDDVLIGMDGDFNVGRWLGQVPALLNQRMCCVRSDDPLITRYLRHVLPAPLKLINDITYSTTVKHLSSYEVLGLKLAMPRDIAEVEQIANFLDRETAKIDALVAEQQRLIELLQEKRQAIITHAVTKGLNPNAPMKDSGVEWLGEMPEHWSVMRIKRLVEVKDGTHATPEYVDPGPESFPLITSKDFINNRIQFEDAKYIAAADHAEISKRSNTEKGDVLMSMIGGNIGKAIIVSDDREFSIKNLALFKARGISEISEFVLYYLSSGLLEVQIDLLSRGGGQGFLGLGDIRNLVFAGMPNDEMKAIVAALNNQTVALNRLIAEVKPTITLLEERRSALISAAVTGQIDVRGLVLEDAGS